MTELVPYSESQGDLLEVQLSAEADKPEIHNEQRAELNIIVYYLRKLGTVSMALLVEGLPTREFPVPNGEVNEAIAHPEAYCAREGLYREVKRGSDE